MSKNEDLTKEDKEKNNSKLIEANIKEEKMPIIHRNKIFRSLIIKKIEEEEKYKNYIKTEIDEYFNSPDKYFDKNSSIAVNKTINIKDINVFTKQPTHRIINKKSNKNMSNFQNLSPIRKKTFMPSILGSSSGNINSNNIPEQLPRYEIIDNEKLKNIFESYKDKNFKKSFIKEYNLELDSKNIPIDLSKSLSVQNNRLKNSRNDMRNLRQMSGLLSKRLNKNKNDLLINSVDSYRYKRELINNIHNKDFSDIYPRYYWKMNLRRGIDSNRRDLYVNIKNIYEPFFGVIVDNPQEKKELKFKSGLDLNCKELKDFKRNKYLIDNYSTKIKNLEKLEKLNVTGKKLFDVEYNREMSSKKRKILHRIFVENGKEIMDSDINEIFGEETIYKNYPKENIGIQKINKSNSYMSRNTINNII